MMNPIRGIVSAFVFAGLLAGSSAMAGHHEPVLQVVSVDVKAGMLEKYRKEVKNLSGVLKSIDSEQLARSSIKAGPKK